MLSLLPWTYHVSNSNLSLMLQEWRVNVARAWLTGTCLTTLINNSHCTFNLIFPYTVAFPLFLKLHKFVEKKYTFSPSTSSRVGDPHIFAYGPNSSGIGFKFSFTIEGGINVLLFPHSSCSCHLPRLAHCHQRVKVETLYTRLLGIHMGVNRTRMVHALEAFRCHYTSTIQFFHLFQ